MIPIHAPKLAVVVLLSIAMYACTSDKTNGPPMPTEEKIASITAQAPERHTNAATPHAPEAYQERAAAVATMRAPSVAAYDVGPRVPDFRYSREMVDRESYGHHDDNPVKLAAESPVSTFSIDVDTGAYANVRRFLNQGRLPARDAVRVEEMINYFSYEYAPPPDKSRPFSITLEVAPTPWNRDTHLLRIGLKGYDVAPDKLPPANLVFLIDVSGSMMPPERLPLLKSGLRLLVQKLRAQDRAALVVYAGASGVVLDSTPGDQKAKILAALDGLTAGGSTNGASGIRLAYTVAEQAYIKDGINRVLLATDGDFNVGTVSFEALKHLIEEKRKTGISLTTLGFGVDNYNERLMEQLADAGNGNYAYIDTLKEAHKVLVHEMSSTLQTIAKDVKIQIEFNPAAVTEYRLIGYENRVLQREDFNNDKVDAGDIGAGHTVTALYEIALAGGNGRRLEPLRYAADKPSDGKKDEMAWLRLRYKLPDGEQSVLIEQPIKAADIKRGVDQASIDFRFASAVAAFGQLLRGGKYTSKFRYDDVLRLAQDARGKDPFGYRGEFLSLVSLAQSLDGADRHARAGE